LAAKLKYEKYIKRQTKPAAKKAAATPVAFEGLENWAGIQHRMYWKHISKPNVMVEEPHSHDFDEFLCFCGADPANAFDLGGEVELSMGKEGEKYVIDTGTIVAVPKGLVHGPLNFKKVTKPMMFSVIYLAPEYVRKPVSKKK
jgi:hypothetical protein